MNSVVTHQISSSAAQAADASKDIDISELMALLNKDCSTILRESHENIALLGSRGASNDHHTSRRGDRLVQSFINVLKNVGKLGIIIPTLTISIRGVFLSLILFITISTDGRKVYADLLKPVQMKKMAKTKEVPNATRPRRIKAAGSQIELKK